MAVRTHYPNQVRSLREHLDQAIGLEPQVLADLSTLAVQLGDCSVLPLVGAGGSYDCGLPLAGPLGADLLADYLANDAYRPHPAGLTADLGDVTEAIYGAAGQAAVVEALGLPDHRLWPAATDVESHFCAYRPLARLAREHLFREAVSLNYDCGYEAALHTEGFMLGRNSVAGRHWQDHVTLIAKKSENDSVVTHGSLTVRKIHGCAAQYRIDYPVDANAADRIVVRRSQLVNWRRDIWARDYLRGAARSSVVLLIGFAGQDPAVVGELEALLQDIYDDSPRTGIPRVVAIDFEPDTIRLRALINAGLGGVPLASNAVAQIRTASGTTSAALLVLLAHTIANDPELAREFVRVGYTLTRSSIESLMTDLVLTAPAMLRWSYVLRPPRPSHYMQRVNVTATEQSYVPLLTDVITTVQALKTRRDLRSALGVPQEEGFADALSADAFVVGASRGAAFMPTGLAFDALRGACRPGGELDHARTILPWPRYLDCILVSDDSSGRRGISLMTGQEVPVP